MKRIAFILLGILVAVCGLIAEIVHQAPPDSSDTKGATAAEQSSAPRRVLKAGDRFRIDATDLRNRLASTSEDERPEQIADWVVYATLVYSRVPGHALRDALYDRPPMRLPVLEESVAFDYGRGRRVILPDKSVWLFRSEIDPHPKATLARLADQVRMELGDKPASFAVFVYRTHLTNGVIDVRKEADVPSAEMFSPAYGYVEAKVHDRASFTTWLEQIDDVVHVRRIEDNALELGGRRFGDASTAGVTLEHVASLYQGHRRIAANHATYDPDPRESALVDALNGSANSGLPLANDAFFRAAKEYAAMLSVWSAQLRAAGYDTSGLGIPKESLPGYVPSVTKIPIPSFYDISGLGIPKPSVEDNDTNRLSIPMQFKVWTLEEQKEFHTSAVEQTGKLMKLVEEARLIMPSEPGFSLDWSFSRQGLVHDLGTLLDQPDALLREARVLARTQSRYDEKARPSLVWAAADTAKAIEGELAMTPAQHDAIAKVIAAIRTQRREDLDGCGIVALSSLIHDSKAGKELPLATLLKYIRNRNGCQCARYDGPMQGTRVGMNLFYTDLLAKLWAAVDYYGKAPVAEVVGFRSGPRVDVERAYWTEVWEKTSTRLWFGPKQESYAVLRQGGEINFAHIATRVFSKGSSETDPMKESSPAEDSRRVFHWWDHHYERVADYEQQYHTQNQIMKWSVITGWAAENHLLEYLDGHDIPVTRDLRFDRWYATNDSLRFRGDIRMLPESRWHGTECMELLRSYPFESAGQVANIEGGVSLGGSQTLREEGAILAENVAPSLRRAGLVEEAGGAIRNVKATEFDLAKDTLETVIKPRAGNFLRSGGAEFNVGTFETSVLESGANGGGLRITAGGQELGRITYEQLNEGVKLGWRQAPGEFAERLTKSVARANDSGLPRVSRDLYFIENSSGGLDAVATIAEDGRQYAYALRSGKDAKGFVGAGFGPSGEFRVKAASIDVADVQRELAEQSWQRIEECPFALCRRFTNKGPGAAAKPFKLRSSSGAEVEAFLDGDAIYLRRPPHADGFETLVEHEGITSKFVREVAKGKATANLLSTPAARLSPGLRAAEAAGRGDLGQAMDQLADAAQHGKLDDALREFNAQYGDAAWKDLTGSSGKLPVTYDSITGKDADAMIERALVSVRDHDPARAAGDLQQALLRGKPSDRALSYLEEASQSPNVQVVAHLAMAREKGTTNGILKLVSVHADDHVLVTSLNLDHATMSAKTVTDKVGMQRAIEYGNEVFYVDHRLLAHFDWDGMPGDSLHRALSDPAVVWEELDVQGMSTFRPSELTQTTLAYTAMQPSTDFHLRSLESLLQGTKHVFRARYYPCPNGATPPDCTQ